jgi:hypothetical protein
MAATTKLGPPLSAISFLACAFPGAIFANASIPIHCICRLSGWSTRALTMFGMGASDSTAVLSTARTLFSLDNPSFFLSCASIDIRCPALPASTELSHRPETRREAWGRGWDGTTRTNKKKKHAYQVSQGRTNTTDVWKGAGMQQSRPASEDTDGREKVEGVAKRRYGLSLSELTCGFFRTASCGLPGGDSTSLSKTPVIFRLRANVGCVAFPSALLPDIFW